LKQDDDEDINMSLPKLIVFFAGGVSYSEIRALRNLPSLQENLITIIGGTALLKQNDYIRGLSDMKD